MNPHYSIASQCLQENLQNLSDGYGNVPPQNQAMWNLSNAMAVVIDGLQAIQIDIQRLRSDLSDIEQRLQR